MTSTLTEELRELLENENLVELEVSQPWNDHRLKLGEEFVGMSKVEMAKFVKFCFTYRKALLEGLELRDKFPKLQNCALLNRATLMFKSRQNSNPAI